MSLSNRKGPLAMVAASICFSFGGVCIKFIPWNAMSIIGLRSLLGAAVLIAYHRSARIRFTRGNVITALCLCATTVLFVFANKLTSAAAAILLQFTAPVFIILLQFLFYRMRPKPIDIIAVLATIAGILLLFADELQSGGMTGNLLAIMSGVTFAGVFLGNTRKDTDPEQALILGFLINAVAGLPFVFTGVSAQPSAWAAVLFLGLVQVGLAYVFFAVSIKSTPALLACLITALEPLLNPVWVALATKEIPGPFTAAGGGVIILAVVGYNIWIEKHAEAAALSE